MLTLGLSDLRTNEIISRLVRPCDVAVDIGANIGIMTSLMALRAGSKGAVYAFEPHPETRARLETNVAAWMACPVQVAPVSVLPYAVSKSSGTGQLFQPQQFSKNSGIATMEHSLNNGANGSSHVDIETRRYDEWAESIEQVRLVKIDVEGHEDSVLEGMSGSLEASKIDYIIFEEMRPLPSPATERLRRFGYNCHMIDRTFWGPSLKEVSDAPKKLRGEATNILAVGAHEGMEDLLRRGWECLQ